MGYYLTHTGKLSTVETEGCRPLVIDSPARAAQYGVPYEAEKPGKRVGADKDPKKKS